MHVKHLVRARAAVRPAAASILALATLSVVAGCATLPSGKHDPRDRFERFNRSVYKFNDTLDRAILRPTATAYVKITPRVARRGISNFMSNLDYPVTIANDFLQGKFRDGASDATRFVVNTVFGIGGLFDPAAREGLDKHDEDFGQTLGKWGVPSGPYLVLPFLGPSTVRDAPSKLVDEYSGPRAYLSDPYVRWGLFGLGKVDQRASLLDADKVLDNAFDPYAFMRNAWLQHREYDVRDGNVPPEELFNDDDGSAAPDAVPTTDPAKP